MITFTLSNTLRGDPTRSPVNTPTAMQISTTRSRGYYPVRATPAGFGAAASSDAEARQLEIMEEQLQISRVGSKITIVLAVLTVGWGAFTIWQSMKKRRG